MNKNMDEAVVPLQSKPLVSGRKLEAAIHGAEPITMDQALSIAISLLAGLEDRLAKAEETQRVLALAVQRLARLEAGATAE